MYDYDYVLREETESWTDIVSVACCGGCVIARKKDGSFIAVGFHGFRPRVITEWSGIKTAGN